MHRNRGRDRRGTRESFEAIVSVPLALIHLSDKNRSRLTRDRGQVEAMRKMYELGASMVPIKLIERGDGSFDIDDGRHRFLAAELAGASVIDAEIV
ncbi:MAG: hypothetical protein U0136_10525 [Bdellovibrionota bacterium]